VKPDRELIVTNMLALLVLLVALLLGWWEAAAFGLAVLIFLDLMAILRGRQPRSDEKRKDNSFDAPEDGDHG
jgi:membrane protein implicated in regulation of membrane protease activity